jgi:hypothetical protein
MQACSPEIISQRDHCVGESFGKPQSDGYTGIDDNDIRAYID